LLVPYTLWTVFYSILSSPVGLNPLRILYHLVTGRAQAQLYYIVVLVELTILTPLIMNALDSKKYSAMILSLTPIYLLLCSGCCYITGAELTWMGRDFCAWLVFYYVGMLVKHFGWTHRKKDFLMFVCIGALFISIGEGVIVNGKLDMFSMATGQINVTTMIYSLTVIALLMNNHDAYRTTALMNNSDDIRGDISEHTKRHSSILWKKLIRAFTYIGDMSFGIYFCHTFVLKCVTFVLKRVGFIEASPLPLIQLVQFCCTLSGSIIGICMIQKVDAKRRLCPHLGF
jgi:hypothetical protein